MNDKTTTALVLTILTVAWLGAAVAQDTAPAGPCDQPEAAHFDFWVGEWDVYAQDKHVGHNRISRIHGGCTLLEEFGSLAGPYEGKSFNYFDATDGHWHQVWVDNGGTRLHLTGGLEESRMVMTGERIARGKPVTDRISWTPNADGTVRQLWELSADGGAVWQVLFDGLYRPAAAGGAEETR